MQSLNRAGEFHRGCYETRQPYIHFFLGDSQRPAPAGHATCARGSHDLRPRVAGFVPKKNGKMPKKIPYFPDSTH